TEAVRQGLRDLRRVQADGRRFIPIDDQIHARALQLHVVRDVLHFRQLGDRLLEPGRPRIQLVVVEALDGEVEAAVAAEAADLKGRRHVDEGTESWEAQQGPPE